MKIFLRNLLNLDFIWISWQAPATPGSWRWKAMGSVVVLALVALAAE